LRANLRRGIKPDFANKNKGKIGILVEPYRKNKTMNENELEEIIIKYEL
jgi:hypothetical protein